MRFRRDDRRPRPANAHALAGMTAGHGWAGKLSRTRFRVEALGEQLSSSDTVDSIRSKNRGRATTQSQVSSRVQLMSRQVQEPLGEGAPCCL